MTRKFTGSALNKVAPNACMFKLVTGIFQFLTCIFQLLTGMFKLTTSYNQVNKIKKVCSPGLL